MGMLAKDGGLWGTHHAILALSDLYQCNIWVDRDHAEETSKIVDSFTGEGTRLLRLTYHTVGYRCGEHYNSIVPSCPRETRASGPVLMEKQQEKSEKARKENNRRQEESLESPEHAMTGQTSAATKLVPGEHAVTDQASAATKLVRADKERQDLLPTSHCEEADEQQQEPAAVSDAMAEYCLQYSYDDDDYSDHHYDEVEDHDREEVGHYAEKQELALMMRIDTDDDEAYQKLKGKKTSSGENAEAMAAEIETARQTAGEAAATGVILQVQQGEQESRRLSFRERFDLIGDLFNDDATIDSDDHMMQ
jgi:hypothetical protein